MTAQLYILVDAHFCIVGDRTCCNGLPKQVVFIRLATDKKGNRVLLLFLLQEFLCFLVTLFFRRDFTFLELQEASNTTAVKSVLVKCSFRMFAQ
jgi:hypothetical protein